MIPFSVGAMTKVGPQNISNAGSEVSNQVNKASVTILYYPHG